MRYFAIFWCGSAVVSNFFLRYCGIGTPPPQYPLLMAESTISFLIAIFVLIFNPSTDEWLFLAFRISLSASLLIPYSSSLPPSIGPSFIRSNSLREVSRTVNTPWIRSPDFYILCCRCLNTWHRSIIGAVSKWMGVCHSNQDSAWVCTFSVSQCTVESRFPVTFIKRPLPPAETPFAKGTWPFYKNFFISFSWAEQSRQMITDLKRQFIAFLETDRRLFACRTSGLQHFRTIV